ncbi:MAG: hypothetical protein Q9216_003702 [Gyalolechia sp. 2 TL-2023]
MISHTRRKERYYLSTLENCADVLASSSDLKISIRKLKTSRFDIQVSFTIGSELARRKRFEEAYFMLHSTVKRLKNRPVYLAGEYAPAVVELIKCCNLLGKKVEGEAIALKALDIDDEPWDVTDSCNLKIVLADSLISQKKYRQAKEILLAIIRSGDISVYMRHVASLRLNKTERRSGTLTTIENLSELTDIENNILDPSTAAVIKDECFDELAATLSCGNTLEAPGIFSKPSFDVIQNILLHLNARMDGFSLEQISSDAETTGDGINDFNRITNQSIRSPSSGLTHGPWTASQQPLKTPSRNHDRSTGNRPNDVVTNTRKIRGVISDLFNHHGQREEWNRQTGHTFGNIHLYSPRMTS